MMFSKVPDKLSVMTYLFQVRTYFNAHPKVESTEGMKPNQQTAGGTDSNPALNCGDNRTTAKNVTAAKKTIVSTKG